MYIVIAAVGRAKPGPERELFDSYAARLPWRVDLKEIEIKTEKSVDVRRAREAEALLAAIPKDARVVALDERGKSETSAAFAQRIARWRDDGAAVLVFIIGGADGLDDSVRKRADATLCFGTLTWPHMLVRALLTEQLYRAHTILTNHPYHRA